MTQPLELVDLVAIDPTPSGSATPTETRRGASEAGVATGTPEAPPDSVFAALRACTLLHPASDDGVSRLAAAAAVRHLEPGEVLVEQDSVAEHFGVVMEGIIPVYALSDDGRRTEFKSAQRGDHVALIPAMASCRHPFGVEAVEPSTIAWMHRSALADLMDTEPWFVRSLVTILVETIVDFNRITRSVTLDVPSRLADFVSRRAVAAGVETPDGLSVPLGMRKYELAAELGTVPETLSRSFAKLTADGLINVRGRTVVILDQARLAHRGKGLPAES